MSIVLTVPSASVGAGIHVFTTANLPSAATRMTITLTQIGWPHALDEAIIFLGELSLDSGVTFDPDFQAGTDFFDAPFTAKNGSILPNAAWAMDLNEGVGLSTRRLRFTANFLKTLTVGFTVDLS